MKIKFCILILLAAFFSTGCAKVKGLLVLKRLASSQKEIVQYLDRQEKLFDKLISDLKNEKIKAGISKHKFISKYGDPVLSKETSKFPGAEALLYRYPTKYFNSDKVYFYFDKSKELISWKYQPYK